MSGPPTAPSAEGMPPLPSGAVEALRRVGRGSGTFVLVAGGSREARAAVLRWVEETASTSGWESLRLRAHPLDEMVPYGALHPWLSQWYRPMHDEGGRAPSGGREASFAMPLVGLIAGLPQRSFTSEAPGTGPERATTASETHPFSPAELRAELVDLVQGRTRQNPAVVLIEDAEFLDVASRDWFSFLGGRMADLPIAVTLSLDDTETAGEWRSHLAQAPSVYFELPQELTPTAGEDRLRARLRVLPDRTVEALALAVLAGPDADRETLKEILHTTDQDLNLALSPAMDAGLLRMVADRYECCEPSLFPDLLGVLDRPQSVRSRRALAQTLGKRTTHRQGKALFRLSDHWAEAGEVAPGVAALIAAAKEAQRWGAPELAEKRLLKAVLLSQTDPTVKGREVEERIYAEIAALRLRAGRPAEGREAYQRALDLAKERGARAVQWGRYVAGLADAESRLGGHPEERLRTTLAQVEGRSPELEALLLRSLSFYYLERARFEEAMLTAERACALADRGRDVPLKVRCRSSAASAYIFSGLHPEKAREHLLKALEQKPSLEGTTDQLLLVNVMDGLSLLECSLGKEDEAIRWGEEGLSTARRHGYGTSLLLVLGNLPEHYVHTRDFARARAITDELRHQVERQALPERDNSRQQLYLLEGRIAAETGDVKTARERFERMVAASEKGGSRVFLGQALVHLIVLEAKNHNLESAHRHYRRLEREGLVKSLMGENRRLLSEVEPLLKGDPGGSRAS